MKKILLPAILLLLFSSAHAQVYTCASCVSMSNTVITSCCATPVPDEGIIAAWAAAKAVSAQLDFFDEKKVQSMSREEIDALQLRVDAICKWAKTLSNHIFSAAYLEWGTVAGSKIAARRSFLDKIDVAKSLATGLPTPPEGK